VLIDTYLDGVTLQNLCDRSASLAHLNRLPIDPAGEDAHTPEVPPNFPQI
jgi:hypothetical protein